MYIGLSTPRDDAFSRVNARVAAAAAAIDTVARWGEELDARAAAFAAAARALGKGGKACASIQEDEAQGKSGGGGGTRSKIQERNPCLGEKQA